MRDIPPSDTKMIQAAVVQRSGFWAAFAAFLAVVIQAEKVITLPDPWDKYLVAASAIAAIILNAFFAAKSYRVRGPKAKGNGR